MEAYTGFSACKFLVEFENELKRKKINRRGSISEGVEAILKPKEFIDFMEGLRAELKHARKRKN